MKGLSIFGLALYMFIVAFGVEAQEQKKPIEKNKPEIIQSLSENFNKGVEITFQENKHEKGIKKITKIPPKVKYKKGPFIYEGAGPKDTVLEKKFEGEGFFMGSEFDGEIIKIGPNLKIALSPSESIVSGDKGATFKRVKGEKGILLIEGKAWLVKQ